MNSESEGQRLIRVLGNSLVCISGSMEFLDADGQREGNAQVFSYTAFAMSFREQPVLVTAGHVISDALDPLLEAKVYKGYKVNIIECNLCDFMGEGRKIIKPMPFDYSLTRRKSIDQSTQRKSQGLDFGIILAHPFFWRSMKANGIEPIPEGRWVENPEERFDVYKMIGIPEDLELAKRGLGQPVLYTVAKSADPEVKVGPDGQPVWFVGRMPEGVKSVRGVSGGPIFGFRKLGQNLWDYRVVAMQSWESRSEGLIYGTPLLSFAPDAAAVIEELKQQVNWDMSEDT